MADIKRKKIEYLANKDASGEVANSGKVPPGDYHAEQSVLGAILLDETAMSKALLFTKTHTFYWEKHRIIFDAMHSLFLRNEPTDLTTVTAELKDSEKLDGVGGLYYISELTETVPFPRNVEYYAKIVQDKYILRALDALGNEIGERIYEPEANPDNVLDWSITELFNIQMNKESTGFRSISPIVSDTYDDLEKLFHREGALTGVTTGYPALDKMTSGLQNSDLIILAARPSMGKTALSLCIGYNCAKEARVPVGFISLEMSAKQIAMRLLSMEARVPLQNVRNANLRPDEWQRIAKATSDLSTIPIFIDDTPGQSITDIRARAQRLKNQHDVGLLIVDYLGLIQPSERRESQQQAIADISRQLKGLAKEMDVPVLALSQLSRAPEQRGESKVPILSDLRDSGALEQDADLVMFIYRQAYYDKLKKKKDGIPDDAEPQEDDNTAKVIVAKQRNGPTGDVDLVFLGEFARFESLETFASPGGNFAN